MTHANSTTSGNSSRRNAKERSLLVMISRVQGALRLLSTQLLKMKISHVDWLGPIFRLPNLPTYLFQSWRWCDQGNWTESYPFVHPYMLIAMQVALGDMHPRMQDMKQSYLNHKHTEMSIPTGPTGPQCRQARSLTIIPSLTRKITTMTVVSARRKTLQTTIA